VTAGGPQPAVLVSVGTDYHQLDRLVDWVDEWLASRQGGPVDCLVQYGTSKQPVRAQGAAYLAHAELERLLGDVSVVVSHGGPSTIAEARRRGHLPIVVPRNPGLGEHVDDHQQRFARRLADAGLVRVVTTAEEFRAALEEALAAPRADDATRETQQRLAQAGAREAVRRFGELVDAMFAESAQRRR
jgi:UDP-N-acetylglucosamine transferase subunit ALG13